jgi:Tol biopolymer transport system component
MSNNHRHNRNRKVIECMLPYVLLIVLICFSGCMTTSPKQIDSASTAWPAQTALPLSTMTQPVEPSGKPWEQIAYISDKSGIAELWFLDIATHSTRQVTTSDCEGLLLARENFRPGVQYFAWAPDGWQIAYVTACSPDQAYLSVADLETGKVFSRIADVGPRSSYPSWSASSKQLVFAVQVTPGESGNNGIYLVDLPGKTDSKASVVYKQVNCLDGCLFATWSPNGKRIAYQGPHVQPPYVNRAYVSIMIADSFVSPSEASIPTVHSAEVYDVTPGGLVWSHDGHRLAIATSHDYDSARLNIVKITDKFEMESEMVLQESYGEETKVFGSGFYTPVFSPDDKMLYFIALRPGHEEAGAFFGTLYRLSVSTKASSNHMDDIQTVSPDDELVGFPSLSCDGMQLAYAVHRDKAIEIWLQTTDGASRQQLVGDTFTNTRPAWRPCH